jgi:predicted transcriptional regulator
MKDTTIKTLDDKDFETIKSLKKYGLDRKLATVVIFLGLNKEPVTSRTIESGTRMAQSEVSLGISAASRKGWISRTSIPGATTHRSVNLYSLAVPIKTILEELEQTIVKTETERKSSFAKLKKIVA